jgi:signal transduction histidine kinase
MIDELQATAFLKKLTVLYVEDDPSTGEQVAEFLRRRTGKVVLAADGEQGLAIFRAAPAGIVVTDIQMPGLNGLAMARAIRELDPAVPIVVTTAFEQPEYLSDAVALGIDQYVLKPIQAERLEFALLTCAHRLLAEEQLRSRRKLEAETARMQDQLALGILLGDVVQDYQLLLQDVLDTMALVQSQLKPAGAGIPFLGRCLKHFDQACFLGSRLLTLADPAGPSPSLGSLDELIRGTVLETLAGAPVTADFQFQGPEAVYFNEAHLAQVFRSLAQNAREAMPAGGTLRVSTEACCGPEREGRQSRPDRQLRIRFQDTGPGIRAEDLPLVFEPHFTTKDHAGLGLPLCQAIIRAHGGSISADSRPGDGATVQILLPTALGPVPA